jgi:hypothetical protein
MVEFYMYGQYQSHDDATLSYKDDTLHTVHTIKDDFLFGRASTRVIAKPNGVGTENMKKRQVDDETDVETEMPSI